MMKKYFRNVDGQALEILDTGTDLPPVFLFHGNSSCAAYFEHLLQSSLARFYRLIAVSFPGHGASPWFTRPDAAVTIAGLGTLSAEIAQSFRFDRYALVGQSLGGHALLESLDAHPRACGLFLVSSPPISPSTLAQAFAPDPIDGLLFKGDLDAGELDRFAGAFVHRAGGASLAMLRNHIAATDRRLRPALGAGLAAGLLEDEVAAFAGATLPIAFVHGLQDRFLRPAYFASLDTSRMWSGQVHAIDDCGHAVALDQPERFVALLGRFLDDAFAARANTSALAAGAPA
jgi:pimeloyl-ACP methyl ester carboxylesterase